MIWCDASALIALARIGRLGLLQRSAETVWTTKIVYEEAAVPGFPESASVVAARQDGWLKVETVRAPRVPPFGLGRGEASLLRRAGDHDLLVLDDGPARRVAQAQGKAVTGILGLLVAAAERDRIEKGEALDAVRALARSDFRMTVALYDWCVARLTHEA